MIIFVDIDDTICYYENNEDILKNYNNAKPYYERIKKINNLYNDKSTIIYWTARGTLTGINWFEITYNQLKSWGCLFHELRMGKPSYDLFIDDKNISSNDFFQNIL
jgi:hypothetical protein